MSNKVIINKQEVQFGTQDNQIFCTSLDVAKVFGKQHKHILELIGEKFNNNEIKNFCEPNFRLSFKTRKIEGFRGRERKYPYYQLTKDGFSFIAMGLTGRKADKFKIAFINAFNEMEKLLQKEIKSPNKYLTDLMELIYPNLPQNDYKVSVTITDNPYSKEAKNVFSLNYLVDNRTPKDPKKLQ
ncbi:Rha family transcriptional regulator [Campylobacter coli]|uniref:Rha family transcriptional regulator n=1 Tax=Campylobacter coli TaxID=195 RepID=UPI00073F82CC|nr:Rha family transcriptional regulator [Campylobacter coli]MCW1332607.1 Rha family transcriptional regulator [Campylobacter jejuni]EAJ8105342.1 phage regulatory protein [Campylobacter coli]EAK7697625.1 phage regulatory protein [Campylobacter coli]EDO6702799.1 Rha family transcriptional regulator [Campylobacter coli]EDO6732737.1 Rha family transcriptional regulator [Campylobacter coli]